MANSETFTSIATSLPDTVVAPHFDRTAFKVIRVFATLAADGLTANLKFTPDEQELKCMVAPEVFTPIENAWGRQGWTTMTLAAASDDDIRAALAIAHIHAVSGPAKVRR